MSRFYSLSDISRLHAASGWECKDLDEAVDYGRKERKFSVADAGSLFRIASALERIANVLENETEESKQLPVKENAVSRSNGGRSLINLTRLLGLHDRMRKRLSKLIPSCVWYKVDKGIRVIVHKAANDRSTWMPILRKIYACQNANDLMEISLDGVGICTKNKWREALAAQKQETVS